MTTDTPRPVSCAVMALVCARRETPDAIAEALWWLRCLIEQSHPKDSGEEAGA